MRFAMSGQMNSPMICLRAMIGTNRATVSDRIGASRLNKPKVKALLRYMALPRRKPDRAVLLKAKILPTRCHTQRQTGRKLPQQGSTRLYAPVAKRLRDYGRKNFAPKSRLWAATKRSFMALRTLSALFFIPVAAKAIDSPELCHGAARRLTAPLPTAGCLPRLPT